MGAIPDGSPTIDADSWTRVIPWLVLLQATLSIATAGPATAPGYLPLWVAQSEGYFAQEGLTVSLVPTRADALAAEALAHGRVNLAATTLDAAIVFGATAGAPPRIVFGLTATPPVVLLVPEARKDAIRSIADLAGSTVGIPAPGTSAESMLLALLARARVPIPKVTVRSFGERALVGAVEAGEVTVGILPDPYATRLIAEGKAVALADFRKRGEMERWFDSHGVHSGLFVPKDTWLGAAELKPLCRALLRAVERVRTATPEELQATLPASVVGFPPEDFAVRLLGARGIFLEDGRVTPEMLKASIALIESRGSIPVRVKMPGNLNRLLLMEPLQEALEPSDR
ncbi:MAG TPA: ABC transporter substrate-binding protein [Candidatus Methylomirabilis sp.]|nr:ABC transporter substrate-binding protein [Candidatus Methylomirabilis sp.]